MSEKLKDAPYTQSAGSEGEKVTVDYTGPCRPLYKSWSFS